MLNAVGRLSNLGDHAEKLCVAVSRALLQEDKTCATKTVVEVMQFQAKELSMAVPLGRLGLVGSSLHQRLPHLGYFLIEFYRSMSSMSVGSCNIVLRKSTGSKPGKLAGGSASLKKKHCCDVSLLLWQHRLPQLLQLRHGMSKVFKQKKEQEKPDEAKRFAVAAFKQVRCHVVMPVRLGQLPTFSQRSDFWLTS